MTAAVKVYIYNKPAFSSGKETFATLALCASEPLAKASSRKKLTRTFESSASTNPRN
jgi:hypothetical protein